ncbi:enoyl-CoA hydratase [Sporothrix brasiliensis 5110]|uniref:Enoyl-CoA hydratase n=1 Tax=Sporothrix brasiliensis 5110 TaxID=1398154 RepID=A0A0C2ESC3_9PEZI|nr:enoyl-CoA hydratase [Sporothrix brasiliensis 5110]KIH89254.1 enoyl-CoA hydratase [Sporothrix brasiliensis 5110]
MSYERKNTTPVADIPLPDNYETFHLPDIRFQHHPANSPAVTPIVLVVLDRPKAHNAFSADMARSLITAFGLLSRDARVRCVVLTGSDMTNNRTFCAGADLDIGFNTGGDTRSNHRDLGGAVSLAIHHCRKPVIAAMNGSGVGVGITMTLPADIRVASNKGKYGFVFARRGLVMEACSSYFLPRLVGHAAAAYLTTTGSVLPASHKMLSPLFAEIVDPDKVLPTALGLAEDIAANTSPVSTRVMKDMLHHGGSTPEEAHLLESSLLFQRFQNRDLKEGMASFLEKRAPNFQGTMEEDGPVEWPWWDTKILERANETDKAKL